MESRTSRRGTTDYLLPRLSNEFIKKYCELGGIDQVLVEYQEYENWDDYAIYHSQSLADYLKYTLDKAHSLAG